LIITRQRCARSWPPAPAGRVTAKEAHDVPKDKPALLFKEIEKMAVTAKRRPSRRRLSGRRAG
jgi:hypothetical protein